jgi:hypothetical protein
MSDNSILNILHRDFINMLIETIILLRRLLLIRLLMLLLHLPCLCSFRSGLGGRGLCHGCPLVSGFPGGYWNFIFF